MTLTKTFPTDRAGGLPVADTRLIVAGMVERDASGNPRVGVFPSNYNPIVTGTSGMAYSIGPFQGVTSRSGVGAEFVANDGAVSVATTAAPGANSRIDVIWVRSLYTTYADGSSDPVFGVTQGTPAALPTKPTIPAGALELATSLVLSTTTQTSTTTITQTIQYTAMRGGIVALRNQAEQDAWGPADGSLAYRIDTDWALQRINGVWKIFGGVTPYADGAVATSTIGGAAWVTLALTGVSGSGVENSGGAGRLTVKQAGRYRFTATAIVVASSYGQGRLRKNGSDSPAVAGSTSPVFASPATGGVAYPFATWEVDMAVDDWMEFQIVSNNGGNLLGGTIQAAYVRPVA